MNQIQDRNRRDRLPNLIHHQYRTVGDIKLGLSWSKVCIKKGCHSAGAKLVNKIHFSQ